MIGAAVEQGVSRALGGALPVRQVNVPQTQQVAGSVHVSNIGQLSELLMKLVNAVYETEIQDKEVQEVKVTNLPTQLEFPKIQKVEVTNQVVFPKEVTANLTPEFHDSIATLIEYIGKIEPTTSVSVAAPDMAPVASQISILKEGIDSVLEELTGIGEKAGSLDVSQELLDSLEGIKASILGIIFPSPKPLPADGNGNVKVVQYNKLIKAMFDSIYATYPTTSTEQYVYKNAGVTVGTVLVTYTDSTKAVLTSVVAS